jgi:hypothetical protein
MHYSLVLFVLLFHVFLLHLYGISILNILHIAFQIPYVYDYTTKLCRQQAEVIQNHDNENVRNIEQGEARQ